MHRNKIDIRILQFQSERKHQNIRRRHVISVDELQDKITKFKSENPNDGSPSITVSII